MQHILLIGSSRRRVYHHYFFALRSTVIEGYIQVFHVNTNRFHVLQPLFPTVLERTIKATLVPNWIQFM